MTTDPMTDAAPASQAPVLTDAEIAFYYRGFLTVLRRYRTLAVTGWIIVAAGFFAVLIGWRTDASVAGVVVSFLTMAAGVAVVHTGVSGLDMYVRIPVRDLQGKRGEPPPAPLGEILEIMNDVSAGGWQEAFTAIRRLRAIGRTCGLPDLPFG